MPKTPNPLMPSGVDSPSGGHMKSFARPEGVELVGRRNRLEPMAKIPRLLRILSPLGTAITLTVAECALPAAGIWPAVFAVDLKSHCHAAAIHETAVLRSVRRV
jgi:hypothetical protein